MSTGFWALLSCLKKWYNFLYGFFQEDLCQTDEVYDPFSPPTIKVTRPARSFCSRWWFHFFLVFNRIQSDFFGKWSNLTRKLGRGLKYLFVSTGFVGKWSNLTTKTRWWFQFFVFNPISGENDPIRLIFFKWVGGKPPTRYNSHVSQPKKWTLTNLSIIMHISDWKLVVVSMVKL